MEDALDSGLAGTQLQDFLEKKVKNAALINGVVHAIRHYKNLDLILPELKNSLVHAVKTITSDSCIIHDHQPEKLPHKHEDPTHPLEPLQPQRSMKIKEHVESIKTMDKEIEEVTDSSETQIPIQTNEEPSKSEPKEIIADIIDQLDIGKCTSFSGVIEAAQKAGIEAEIAESAIKELMDEGRCYEPKIGTLRKV